MGHAKGLPALLKQRALGIPAGPGAGARRSCRGSAVSPYPDEPAARLPPRDGEVIGAPLPPPDIVDDVVRAEADGFGSAWSVHFSRGVDALDVLAVAGTRTSRIDLGVGIVPTYPRHPLALAQQAATTQAFCGGRLTLGVGVSHRPVIEDLHGITYARPAAHMRDYLERQGAPSPGALAITGAEAEVEKQLGRLADLGVTEFWPIIFPVGDDPASSRHMTRALLSRLATAS